MSSLHPVLRVVLVGIRRSGDDCVWAKMRGHERTLLPLIWAHLLVTRDVITVGQVRPSGYWDQGGMDGTFCKHVTNVVEFPEPTGLYCNMMPFVLGSEQSLPLRFQRYWPLLKKLPIPVEERGQVGYLTIDERPVEAGEAQRRPGLHCESPGLLERGGVVGEREGGVVALAWGLGGYVRDKLSGGIYMVSNVSNSCAVWDVAIEAAAIGAQGGVEHLRPLLPRGHRMGAREVWWLTDRTPHEALRLTEAAERQFVRVVAGSVSVWYAAHSTVNPLVALPAEVECIEGDKFHGPVDPVAAVPVKERHAIKPARGSQPPCPHGTECFQRNEKHRTKYRHE